MGKLSIKEKARRYDEALDEARKLTTNLPNGRNDRLYHVWDLETIFPELKDEDERIREQILDYFIAKKVNEPQPVLDSWIDWLEKQASVSNPYSGVSFDYNGHTWSMCVRNGSVDILRDKQLVGYIESQSESKLTVNVKPKFKVGDYIERKDGLGCHAKIIFVGGNVYGCEKLIYSEDSSPFFEFMFKNQDEFQISSDFKQKSAWSEEDERILHDIELCIEFFLEDGSTIAPACETVKEEALAWIKSLKEKIGG